MRNIIFTSLIGLMPAMTMAQGPDTGCFERSYSQRHLAANPAQIVSKLRLLIYDHPTQSYTLGVIEAQMTDQGRLTGTDIAGLTLRQDLFCSEDDGDKNCGVECDGGFFTVTRQDKSGLTFRTNYLTIGRNDSCGGITDLAEIQGQYVSYRLVAVPLSVCDRLLDN